jgi:hypothetical protein
LRSLYWPEHYILGLPVAFEGICVDLNYVSNSTQQRLAGSLGYISEEYNFSIQLKFPCICVGKSNACSQSALGLTRLHIAEIGILPICLPALLANLCNPLTSPCSRFNTRIVPGKLNDFRNPNPFKPSIHFRVLTQHEVIRPCNML